MVHKLKNIKEILNFYVNNSLKFRKKKKLDEFKSQRKFVDENNFQKNFVRKKR